MQGPLNPGSAGRAARHSSHDRAPRFELSRGPPGASCPRGATANLTGRGLRTRPYSPHPPYTHTPTSQTSPGPPTWGAHSLGSTRTGGWGGGRPSARHCVLQTAGSGKMGGWDVRSGPLPVPKRLLT